MNNDWYDNYYGNMVTDEDGISYLGGMRGMFESKILGFCGCASEEIIDDVINVLHIFIYDQKNSYYTKIAKELRLDEKYVELILYLLDDKGLLEHGSSVRGSWLSDKGKEIIKKYKEVFGDLEVKK